MPGCLVPPDPANGNLVVDPAPSLYGDWAELNSITTLTCNVNFRPSIPSNATCTASSYDADIAAATCVPGLGPHDRAREPGMHCVPGCTVPPNPANGNLSVAPAPTLYDDWADVNSVTTLTCDANFRPSSPASATCTTSDYDADIAAATCVPGSDWTPFGAGRVRTAVARLPRAAQSRQRLLQLHVQPGQ